MDVSKLTSDLKRDEGVIPHAYQDHLGYWTIGVGRLIDERRHGGLSPDEIEYLLANDIRKKHAELDAALPWISQLNEVRQRALMNMAFQLGVNGLLGFTNTLRLMRAGKFKEAAESALASKWAVQTPERAERIAAMIETGADNG